MTIREGKFLILASLLICIAAYFSKGHYHADEHHQIFEFAAAKLGHKSTAELPWEYAERMRPSVQPSLVVLVHHILRPLGLEDPFRIAWLMRLLSGLLSLWAMWALYFRLRYRFENHVVRSWFRTLSFFLWVLIYHGVRYSAESWSASLFVLGLAHALSGKRLRWSDHLLIGVLMGSAFIFRFQTGFFIVGYLAWLVVKEKIVLKHIASYALGGFCLLAVGALIDRWFYGEWVFTPYNFFEQNILLDKASGFGVEPWWYYVSSTLELGVPPFSLFFILAVLIGVFLFRPNMITWALVPYTVIHLFIGHKELRFFFPLVVFLPYLIARSVQFIRENFRPMLLKESWAMLTVRLFWIWNVTLLLIVCFKPADHDVAMWETIQNRYTTPTVIHYNENSPYGFELQHDYFRPSHISIKHVGSLAQFDRTDGKYVLFTRQPEFLNESGIRADTVFRTFPEWVRHFNFNGWLDRTKQDYLLEFEHQP